MLIAASFGLRSIDSGLSSLKDATRNASDAGGVVGPDVVAACALSAVPGMGATSLSRVAEAFGSLTEALDAGPANILKRQTELRLRQQTLDFLARKPDLEELGLWAVAAARKAGARVVVLGDPWYPPLLRDIENPPVLLYVRGNLVAETRRVAIVGSREADDYGLEIAKSLGDDFARAGVQVVSGGARGIDAAAHAGALWGTGSTVAVLGCGIDIVYPPENGALLDRLATGGGAVVSEFTPGTPPLTPNFPRRNRTISGLSSAVIVVRAASRSGALITANHAAQQGRALFAVPGQANDALSAGPNSLLTLGAARAATSARDVLQALGWPVPHSLLEEPELPRRPAAPDWPAPPEAVASPPPRPGEEQLVDEKSMELWRLLDARAPAHVDELVVKVQLPAQEVLRRLAALEQKGMCVQRPGKYFLRR